MELENKMIIFDDQVLFRKGMKLLLETDGMGVVIGEAQSKPEFFYLLEHQQPDLVLINFEMPILDGWGIIKEVLLKYPGLKILIYNLIWQRNSNLDLVNAGAMGFLLKSSGLSELKKAIITVLDGDSYYPGELMRIIILNSGKLPTISGKSGGMVIELSNREIEILQCFCKGLTANEIADKLCRSIKTIECHRSRLLQKTATKNTINLVLFAIKNKLVSV